MAQFENLRTEHDALQTRVMRALRTLIAESKVKSKHVDSKVIKVDREYEIAILNDELVLISVDGLQYNINVFNLDELINIINKQ